MLGGITWKHFAAKGEIRRFTQPCLYFLHTKREEQSCVLCFSEASGYSV